MTHYINRRVDLLKIEDFERFPIWEFSDNENLGLMVHPVEDLPVSTMSGRMVGTKVVLANGRIVWALISNIEVAHRLSTEHFLSLSVNIDGRWHHLSRYHDPDYSRNGPEALAKALGLDVDEVFPIEYDVSSHIVGDTGALIGTIPKNPKKRLEDDELINLALK